MRRRVNIGNQWFEWATRAGVQARPDALIFFCGAIAAAGAVVLIEIRHQKSNEHYEARRDAGLTQLNETEYLPGPRCLDQASKEPGAAKKSNAEPAFISAARADQPANNRPSH